MAIGLDLDRLARTKDGGPLPFLRPDGPLGPFPEQIEAGVGRACESDLLPWQGTLYGPALGVICSTRQTRTPEAAARELADFLGALGYVARDRVARGEGE